MKGIPFFSNNRKCAILPIIIVFCLPVLLYLQTLGFGFTYFDDNLIIINNISFLSDFGNILKAFLTDQFISKASPFYRPLGTLSYMIDIKLFWSCHLKNCKYYLAWSNNIERSRDHSEEPK